MRHDCPPAALILSSGGDRCRRPTFALPRGATGGPGAEKERRRREPPSGAEGPLDSRLLSRGQTPHAAAESEGNQADTTFQPSRRTGGNDHLPDRPPLQRSRPPQRRPARTRSVSPGRRYTPSMSRGRSVLRWTLWLTVGALLLLRAGTLVTTGSGALVFGPAVFSAATVMWLFVTLAVVWRRLTRTNE